MQFQVPQFIDVAPKIVGPLTLRQFLYIAAASLISFILFFALAFFLWIIIAGVLVGGAALLAFGKVNGQPIERVALAAFQYFWNPRIYIWKHIEEKPKLPTLPALPKKPVINLRELAGGLTKPFAPREKTAPVEPPKERMPLKDLSLKIATTARPIEKREKSNRFLGFFDREKDSFEEFRKDTGEREEARRIDYR